MGEMGEVFKEMQQDKKERHNKWYEKNMKVLNESGLKFRNSNFTCLLFREKGKPKVDFYPHTGRWKVGTKMFSGGAVSFINWYKKQKDTK